MIAGEAPTVTPRPGQRFFITGLGIGQIISWGTLYYSLDCRGSIMNCEPNKKYSNCKNDKTLSL